MRRAGVAGALATCAALALTSCAVVHPPARAPGGPSSEATPTLAPPASAVAAPSSPTEPPFADPPGELAGFLRGGGTPRPHARSIRFDVDALPVATWGPPLPGAGFVLRPITDGWSVFVRTTIFAEVVVSASASYEEHGTSPVGFSAYTASSFGAGTVPPCGKGTGGKRLAVWGGMRAAGWTDDGVDVEMEQGDYDLARCEGLPRRSLQGRAKAVVPGYVYALRLREEPEDDRPGPESLLVFLPRGVLVSASADPAVPIQTTNTGNFTRLTLPLATGEAGTASLHVSEASLRMWRGMREGRRTPVLEEARLESDLVVGVDVTSDVDRRVGTVSFAMRHGADRRPYARLLAAARVELPAD